MKKLLILFATAAMIFVGGCQKYNDTPLKNRVGNLENRVAALEELCKQMNTNISSLQTIVTALQNNDYITSVTPVTKNGETIGYTISFTKSAPITIYHGENGKDGVNGSDGKDGLNGTDGHTPIIGVRQDTDGVYYWTLDDDWLLDSSGNKVKAEGRDGQNGTDGKDGQNGVNGSDGKDGADGRDGIIPQLKIEGGYWFVSTDSGATWTNLGKATGEDGKDGADGKDGQNGTNGFDGKDGVDGDSFFRSITQDDDFLYLTFLTEERITLPKHRSLSVVFDGIENVCVLANKTYSIGYTITGADENTVIKALAQDGFHAVVSKTDIARGTIEITTPSTVLPTEVIVLVSDGRGRTIMRSINFVDGVILIASKSYSVDYNGGTVTIDLSTNIDYTVEIPEKDREWISIADTRTRAEMRDEAVTLSIAPNTMSSTRYATIKLVYAFGNKCETILIRQTGGNSRMFNVATAGTLNVLVGTDNKIEELVLSGTLNESDFNFISMMGNLKLLDLSGLNNKTLPVNCFEKSTIQTVIMPLNLISIPSHAFYQASITSIYIPETVKTIGNAAFYGCSGLASITIPDNVREIKDYAFYGCSGLARIIIPSNVTEIKECTFMSCNSLTSVAIPSNVTKINNAAFAGCTNLTSVTIPSNVTEIGPNAFNCCSSLTSITIPDGVTEIKDYTFGWCSSLESITIPDKVTRIGYRAFEYCESIASIYCKSATPPSVEDSTFRNAATDFKLYVPYESVRDYKGASYYSFLSIYGYDFESNIIIN